MQRTQFSNIYMFLISLLILQAVQSQITTGSSELDMDFDQAQNVSESMTELNSTSLDYDLENETDISNLTRLNVPVVRVPTYHHPIRNSHSSSSSSSDNSQSQDHVESQYLILPPTLPDIRLDFDYLPAPIARFLSISLLTTARFWLPSIFSRKKRSTYSEEHYDKLQEAVSKYEKLNRKK